MVNTTEQIAEQLERLVVHKVGQLYAVQSEDGLKYHSMKEKQLSDNILESHINGGFTIAVKLLQQRTQMTKAICIDFDNDGKKTLKEMYEYAQQIAEVFQKYGLKAQLEFSGRRGFHLWLFFEAPITGILARQLVYDVCAVASFVPEEVYPADNYMDDDGKGKGGHPVKLPCGIHKASNKRSGFLADEVSWDSEGYPLLPENQAELMSGFTQIKIEAVKHAVTLLEQRSEPKANKPEGRHNQQVDVDFSNLGENQHPPCIQYLLEHGAPLDQQYNEANMTIGRYAASKGLSEQEAVGLATMMADKTSPKHNTAKKTVEEKVANFISVWKSISENAGEYKWSCGYILGSDEIMSSGVCPRWNCPQWSYERAYEDVNWKTTEADRMIEQVVLASILKNSPVVDVSILREIPPEGFVDRVELENKEKKNEKILVPLNRMMWEAFPSLIEANDEINSRNVLAAISSKLKPDYHFAALLYMDYLEMPDSCSAKDFESCLRKIKERGLRIKALEQSAEATKAIRNMEVPLAVTIDAVISNHKFLQGQTVSDVQPLSSFETELVEDLFEQPVYSIPTPSAWLNYIFNGGWQTQKLYVISAPPGSGKTTFCSWCADHAASIGTKVLFVPYEMDKRSLWINSLARIGGINSALIEAKRWNDSTYPEADSLKPLVIDAIRNVSKTISKNTTVYEAGPATATAQLKGIIARTRQQAGIAEDEPILVVVDYLQLMPSGDDKLDSGLNETARVSKIATQLKQLARDTNTAVIAISDITKQAYQEAEKSGNLDMSALRDSFKISHAADSVMLLQTNQDQLQVVSKLGMFNQRPGMISTLYGTYPLNKAAKAVYARLSVLKNRGGVKGEPLFVYEKAYHRFIPMELDGVRMEELSNDEPEISNS